MFFVVTGYPKSGNEQKRRRFMLKAINVTKSTFEIENYGYCCEGNCSINQSMIRYTYFLTEEECRKRGAIDD